jgi:hypothetical protein
MGVLVAGSSVRPPTLIKIESSGPIGRALPSRELFAETLGSVNRFCRDSGARSAHQAIDHAVQLVEIAALFDEIAVG